MQFGDQDFSIAAMNSSSFLLFWVHFFLFFNLKFPPVSSPSLPANNITLYGDAHLRNSAIILTQERSCNSSPFSSLSIVATSSSASSSSSGVGRALYVRQVRFLDPRTNSSASFSCRFSFSIIPSPSCPFGDGLAFLITSNADSFCLSDGFMGLPGPALNPRDSFIAVEFDTSSDPSLGDINDDHIGIDVSTVASFASVDAVSKGIDLKSRRQINAWIEYNDAANLIQVWASYSQIRPRNPLLVARVDLSEHFKEFMRVGFSASNGQGSAAHIIHHWRFRTHSSLPSVTPVDSIEEGDCFFCSPGAKSDNGSRSGLHARRTKIEEIALGLGGLAAFILSVIAIVGVVIFFVTKKKTRIEGNKEGQTSRVDRVPKRLSIAEVRSATMGFHPTRIVGEGASATVYKGTLPSGVAVAIKRFDRPGMDCARNPFITEFATMVGCLRHKNLVQFYGWCCEGSELLLVYEYLPNGSLDKVLHKGTNPAIFLSWKQRLNILLGVASALSYLHEECERQIIHRDVKACNILLDSEFNAKLGDFGLAEVYEHTNSMIRNATIPAGTMGYLAPEYVYSGVPSVKTDVYSFGVVVLEVATGRRAVNDDGIVLVDWVWGLWEKGKVIKAADPKLAGRFRRLEMERMLLVGLSCVHTDHEKRPTVKEAAGILRGELPPPLLPARKPRMGFQHVLPEDSDRTKNLGGDQSPVTDDMPWMTPRTHFG